MSVNGHLNKVAYSGSLLEYSFSEANQQKYVLLIDAEPNQEVAIQTIPLTKGKALARKKFESTEDALDWLRANQHLYVELTIVSDEFLALHIKIGFTLLLLKT